MIDWKEGAVCYADGEQWLLGKNNMLLSFCGDSMAFEVAIHCDDFQLNEPREGYYIPKTELDTEEKYNQAVEVFGLFGFKSLSIQPLNFRLLMGCGFDFILLKGGIYNTSGFSGALKVKLTFDQLMAIGELKREMDERKLSLKITKAAGDFGVSDTELAAFKEKPKRRNKSKQAYDILKDLDYEYDLVKQQWYKKQYI